MKATVAKPRLVPNNAHPKRKVKGRIKKFT